MGVPSLRQARIGVPAPRTKQVRCRHAPQHVSIQVAIPRLSQYGHDDARGPRNRRALRARHQRPMPSYGLIRISAVAWWIIHFLNRVEIACDTSVLKMVMPKT